MNRILLGCLALCSCGGVVTSGNGGTDGGPIDGRAVDVGMPLDGSSPDVLKDGPPVDDGPGSDGGCVPACAGACIDARCLLTLSTSGGGGPLALNASSAYWLDIVMKTVMTVPLSGGTSTTLAVGQAGLFALAVSADNVYWTEHGSVADDGILSVPVSGGVPSTFAAGQASANGLAVHGSRLYWTNGLTDGGALGASGTVVSAPFEGALDGGSIATLASGQDVPFGIAMNDSNVYWSAHGTIATIPLDGGSATTLVSGPLPKNPFGLALDGVNVYWTDYGSGTVMSVPQAGGAAVTLASGRLHPSAVAVDDSNVYWLDSDAVMTVPSSGGSPTTLSTSTGGLGIAVDATSLYWTTVSGVLKLTPK
jgi:hypothetical protein